MSNNVHVWQRQDLAKSFLNDVRGGTPLAAEQINVLLRVVRHTIPKVAKVLDVGCGDGVLGRTVMGEHPEAVGVFLDFSEHMIEAATKKADRHKVAQRHEISLPSSGNIESVRP